MGMPVVLAGYDEHVDTASVDRAFAWLAFVDATFSTYREDSQISAINRGELEVADANAAVRSVLARCEELRELTGGYFDARVPAERLPPSGGVPAGRDGHALDPSGLVKGWAIAGAARLLDGAGLRSFSIDAAGDLFVRGRPDGAPHWRVGIRHPRLRDAVAAVLGVSDMGVATSGAYERGTHIVDPHTGRPPQGVLSVTVVAPDIATADAYATAAFARGADGASWCASLDGCAAMVILEDDRVLSTPAMRRFRVASTSD